MMWLWFKLFVCVFECSVCVLLFYCELFFLWGEGRFVYVLNYSYAGLIVVFLFVVLTCFRWFCACAFHLVVLLFCLCCFFEMLFRWSFFVRFLLLSFCVLFYDAHIVSNSFFVRLIAFWGCVRFLLLCFGLCVFELVMFEQFLRVCLIVMFVVVLDVFVYACCCCVFCFRFYDVCMLV